MTGNQILAAMAVTWFICAVLCAVLAHAKHRSEGGWFLAGLLAGIFGLIAAVGMPALEARKRESVRISTVVTVAARFAIAIWTILVLYWFVSDLVAPGPTMGTGEFIRSFVLSLILWSAIGIPAIALAKATADE